MTITIIKMVMHLINLNGISLNIEKRNGLMIKGEIDKLIMHTF